MKNEVGMKHGLLRLQDVNLGLWFGPQLVSILTGLVQQELELAAKEPEAEEEGPACLYE
jgi:hypothetical protein